MYTRYAQRHSWGVEVLSSTETGLGSIREIVFQIDGDGAYSRLKHESGTHRVQRVPVTESSGRIHTSATTVAVLPEAEEIDVQIDPDDLEIDVFLAGGHGGQSVQKNSTAIRITHKPSGMVVQCQDERSQLKNKEKAMAVLRSRLLAQEVERQQAEISQDRKSQVGTGDRSGRVRTYNFPQDRVTDHRVGYTRHNLEAVLDGEIDDILHRLVEAGAGSEPGELRRMRLREAWVRSRRRLERANIPDADIEAQVLLRNSLGIDRATFHASPDRELSHEDAEAFHGTVERRIEGEPLSYITGYREFYGLDFVVTPDVLVPRQETEFLVEAVLEYARDRVEGALTIADIGTGSGAIAVALARHLPNAAVCATDVSRGALRVADENVQRHGLDGRVHLRHGDLFEALDGRVDVVASNPPYLSDDEVAEAPAGRSARTDACTCRRIGRDGRAAEADRGSA